MNRLFYLFPLLFLIGCSHFDETPSQFNNPATDGQYPFLFSTDNTLYMSWLEQSNDNSYLLYASYEDGSWSSVDTIAQGTDWFVNWADFPSVIANEEGPIASHWLRKTKGGTYAYDVNISMTNRTGWTKAIIPHQDKTATEHGFVSMIPWHDNQILAVWLDGRQTDGRSDEDYFNLDYAMTLRAAIISESGNIIDKFLIDDSVCDCCQTSLVKTPKGAVVAYRNRAEGEIRDIYSSRFDGEKWSQPTSVHNDNWKIGACPVNGPKLAADDSLVALTWFTGSDGEPTVKAAISNDFGHSYSSPFILNENRAIGRVNTTIHDNKTYFSWMEYGDTTGTLKMRYLYEDDISEPTTITTIDPARKTGFPQLEILGDELIWAWTDLDEESSRIEMVRLQITD